MGGGCVRRLLEPSALDARSTTTRQPNPTADPTKLTKAKRMQKIEPLYDRYVAWVCCCGGGVDVGWGKGGVQEVMGGWLTCLVPIPKHKTKHSFNPPNSWRLSRRKG